MIYLGKDWNLSISSLSHSPLPLPRRDGMIKRPAGTENYLNKLIEEERRTYLEDLLDKDGEEEEDGLTMSMK